MLYTSFGLTKGKISPIESSSHGNQPAWKRKNNIYAIESRTKNTIDHLLEKDLLKL